MINFKITFLFFLLSLSHGITISQERIVVGAEQINEFLPVLKNKKVGVVAHQASLINSKTHLIDSLLSLEINIVKVFAPEHGFRGKLDAGEVFDDNIDNKTNLPIVSLYGEKKKPSEDDLNGISIMVFDLQDVGVRFYTYLSTLHYIMEACSEKNIPLLLLDRPNPNIHYVDGPVLDIKNKSFVGMHPVPIVYGMTIGEYAKMINGEGWLKEGAECNLKVIKIKNYSHQSSYDLKIRPSPNLPNPQSVALYPSLCLLEPTLISIGRGTEMQFQVYGSPKFPKGTFNFTPEPNFGAKNPKLKNEICYGVDLRSIDRPEQIEIKWLLDSYSKFPIKKDFFLKGFDRISGTESLKEQIISGVSEKKIRKSWEKKLGEFKEIRKKYLLYP
ncbi:MAG: DUF1343 domain-containing protein [Bacteroidota bacterium]|nr:DUF1343 domain-containing protein [Bacteroidota bacterium]